MASQHHLCIQLISGPNNEQFLRLQQVPLTRAAAYIAQASRIYPGSKADLLYYQGFDEKARKFEAFASPFCGATQLVVGEQGAIFRIGASNALVGTDVIRQLIQDRDVDAWITHRFQAYMVELDPPTFADASSSEQGVKYVADDSAPQKARISDANVKFLYKERLPGAEDAHTYVVSKPALVQACAMVLSTIDHLSTSALKALWAEAQQPPYLLQTPQREFAILSKDMVCMTAADALWVLRTLVAGTKWDAPVKLYNALRAESTCPDHIVKYPFTLSLVMPPFLYAPPKPKVVSVFSELTRSNYVLQGINTDVLPLEFEVLSVLSESDEHASLSELLSEVMQVMEGLPADKKSHACRIIGTILGAAGSPTPSWIDATHVATQPIPASNPGGQAADQQDDEEQDNQVVFQPHITCFQPLIDFPAPACGPGDTLMPWDAFSICATDPPKNPAK